jgi:hypothetical protein
MFPYLSEISPLGVVVAFVAAMALGFAWHSPVLFGNEWMKLVGLNAHDAEKNAGKCMLYGSLATLLSVFLIVVLLLVAAPVTWLEAVIWGALSWLAFTGYTLLNEVIWARRPSRLFLINAGYTFLMTELVILVYWLLS